MKNVYLSIFILTNSILVFCQTSPNKEKLFVPNGKVALIGYGSLMSIASMEKTLGHTYTDKFIPIHINGFERVWNLGIPNNGTLVPSLFYYVMAGDTIFSKQLVFLNIQENRKKSMNACLFIIDTVELKKFDEREIGYKRIRLNSQIKEFEIVGGDVFAYIGLPTFTIKTTDDPKDNVIFRHYIKLVEEDSLLALGEQFRNEYYLTTLPYSPKILMTIKSKPIKK